MFDQNKASTDISRIKFLKSLYFAYLDLNTAEAKYFSPINDIPTKRQSSMWTKSKYKTELFFKQYIPRQ